MGQIQKIVIGEGDALNESRPGQWVKISQRMRSDDFLKLMRAVSILESFDAEGADYVEKIEQLDAAVRDIYPILCKSVVAWNWTRLDEEGKDTGKTYGKRPKVENLWDLDLLSEGVWLIMKLADVVFASKK
jgi:hypothetical protein